MNEDLGPNVFCAWCHKELAALGSGLSFSLCKSCVPLVRAEFDARRAAATHARKPKRSAAPAPPETGPSG